MNKTVLLAEDDILICQAYKYGLEGQGFDVIIVNNGEDAIKMAKKKKPNLILLDILMPIKNGFEAAEEIKNDSELADIPIIILSNIMEDTDIDKGNKIGISEYFVKSNLTMKEVISKIRKYV